jgi:hypothetical protein
VGQYTHLLLRTRLRFSAGAVVSFLATVSPLQAPSSGGAASSGGGSPSSQQRAGPSLRCLFDTTTCSTRPTVLSYTTRRGTEVPRPRGRGRAAASLVGGVQQV